MPSLVSIEFFVDGTNLSKQPDLSQKSQLDFPLFIESKLNVDQKINTELLNATEIRFKHISRMFDSSVKYVWATTHVFISV